MRVHGLSFLYKNFITIITIYIFNVPSQSFYLVTLLLFVHCNNYLLINSWDVLVVSDFELLSRYYIYFWERCEPPYPPSYGLNHTTTVFLEGWIWHQITHEG